jgi:hypothetical protein
MAGNQYSPDPRQQLFLAYYTNPDSETFSNALQSGLKAGYTQEYSESITAKNPDWLAENVGDQKMLADAEKVLAEALQIDVRDEKIGDRAMRVGMFIAKTIGKEKYSERIEQTGKGGKDLIPEGLPKDKQDELLALLKHD